MQSLGIEKLSKSQLSRLAKELDADVKAIRDRKLAGAYRASFPEGRCAPRGTREEMPWGRC